MSPDPISYLLSNNLDSTVIYRFGALRSWMIGNSDSWQSRSLEPLDRLIGDHLHLGVEHYTRKFPGTKAQLDQAILSQLGDSQVKEMAQACVALSAEPLMMEIFGYILVYCTVTWESVGRSVWLAFIAAVTRLSSPYALA